MSACRSQAEVVVDALLDALPDIRRALAADAEAAFRGDPAAGSHEEAIFWLIPRPESISTPAPPSVRGYSSTTGPVW